MGRKPSLPERRTVHSVQRLRSYGGEYAARGERLEAALNQIGAAFGQAPLDTSDAAMEWPV